MAAQRLFSLIKQHAGFCDRACISTEVYHGVKSFSKRPHVISRPIQIFYSGLHIAHFSTLDVGPSRENIFSLGNRGVFVIVLAHPGCWDEISLLAL